MFAVRALEALGTQLAGNVEPNFIYDEQFGGELGHGWLVKQGLTKPDLAIAASLSSFECRTPCPAPGHCR